MKIIDETNTEGFTSYAGATDGDLTANTVGIAGWGLMSSAALVGTGLTAVNGDIVKSFWNLGLAGITGTFCAERVLRRKRMVGRKDRRETTPETTTVDTTVTPVED